MHLRVDLHKVASLPEVRGGERIVDFVEVQNFLKRFGYLKPDAGEAPSTLDAGTSEALRRFQERYGVGRPGVFDGATRDFMAADRCGMPDSQNALAFSTRCAWQHRNLSFAFGPLSADVGNDPARTAVRNAFATFQAAGVGLSFTEVATNQSPDIQIE